jgi:hypothetical protein
MLPHRVGRPEPDRRPNSRVPGVPEMIIVGNPRNEKGEVVGASAIRQGFHSARPPQG